MSINHLRGVRKLLRYGTLPHLRNAAGQTPLHLALLTGKLKAARLLLERSVAMRAEAKKPLPYMINLQVRCRAFSMRWLTGHVGAALAHALCPAVAEQHQCRSGSCNECAVTAALQV